MTQSNVYSKKLQKMKTNLVNKDISIGKSAIVLTICKVLKLVITIVTSMILSRYLVLSEYGTYSELLTVASLFVSIFSIGLPDCLNYFIPKHTSQSEKIKLFRNYFTIVLIISILISLLALFLAPYVSAYYHNGQIKTYFYFLMIIPASNILLLTRSNMLVASNKTKRELIYSLCNAGCLLVAVIIILLLKLSFTSFVIIYVVIESFFAITVIFEAFYLCEKPFAPQIDLSLLRRILYFSIPLGISLAISTISLDLDKLIVGYFYDEASVAIYANAGKELPFTLLTSSFSAVILPQLVSLKNNPFKAITIWKKGMDICFCALSFCCFACIVFAPQIMTLLYSDKYLPGVPIFRIYSILLLVRITYWGMILNSRGKTKLLLLSSSLSLLLNLCLSILLTKILGLIGPAIATVISISFVAFMNLSLTKKETKIPISSCLPLKSFVYCLLINYPLGLLVFKTVDYIGIGTSKKAIFVAFLIGFIWATLYFVFVAKHLRKTWAAFSKPKDHS